MPVEGNQYMPINFNEYLANYRKDINIQTFPPYLRAMGRDYFPIYNNLNASRWTTGYVPEVHSSFLSFKKAKSIKDTLRNKILGGGIFLQGISDELLDEDEFYQFLSEACDNICTKGSCLGKIDKVDGMLSLVVVPLGYYKVKYKGRKKIIASQCFLDIIQDEDGLGGYVLVENRYFKQNANYSFGKYSVERWGWDKTSSNEVNRSEIEYKDMPQKIKDWIASQNISLNEQQLFKGSLGVYQFDYTWTNSNYPFSKVGESPISVIEDQLYALDHAFTAKENDKYLGRGRAIVPKAMQGGINYGSSNSVVNSIGVSMMPNIGMTRTPLDPSFYNEVPAVNGMDKAKPESIQFALRTSEWRTEIEGIIGDIASNLQITASAFDSRQLGGGNKTAYQISCEEDMTKATIEDKRRLLNVGLKRLFIDLQTFYGLAEPITMRWPQSGLSNYTLRSQTTINEYQAGLASLETSVKKLHPDWSDDGIKKEIDALSSKTQDIINQFNNEDNKGEDDEDDDD